MPPKVPAHITAAYRKLHWGMDGTRVFEFDDSALPDPAVSLGALGEVAFIGSAKDAEEQALQFHEGCQLVVGPKHPCRLYAGLTPSMRKWARSNLWAAYDVPVWDLGRLAGTIGGKQNRLGYERVQVKPVGEVVAVIYYTAKLDDFEDDGGQPSYYEHEFGDPTPGINPWLAVSADGRLWFVGGDYFVADHGIID